MTDESTTEDNRVDAGHPDVPGHRYQKFPSLANPSMEIYVELADGHTSMFEGAGHVHISADNDVVQTYPFDNTMDEEELQFPQVTRQAKGFAWGYYRADRNARGLNPDATRRLTTIPVVIGPTNIGMDKLALEFDVHRREDWAIGLDADIDAVRDFIEAEGLQVRTVTENQVRIDPDSPDDETADDAGMGGERAADFM